MNLSDDVKIVKQNKLTEEEKEMIKQALNKEYPPDEIREKEWEDDQRYLGTWDKEEVG